MKITLLSLLSLTVLLVRSGFCEPEINRPLSTLAMITSPDSSIEGRLKAVHSLPVNLKTGEIKDYCQFINSLPDTREKNPAALQLIKNDLLNVLMEQTMPPQELTDAMLATYQNQKQDAVTRDYVLQHLITWDEQGAAGSSVAKGKICDLLTKTVRADGVMAATALLGMHRLATIDPAFKHSEIKKYSLAMADSHHPAPVRITAIQVCAEEKNMEALPLIRSIALSESPEALRISAIGALGQIGVVEDISTLQQLAANRETGLRPAIEAALQRLQREFHLQKVALNLN